LTFQADISDLVTEDTDAFHFSLGGQKHSFVAANTAERDGWVLSLKTKSAEAKELAPTVKEHETYVSKLEALKPAAPVAAAVATPKKSVEVKKEEKAEAKEEKKEEKAEAKDVKKDTKRTRSASRKRTSIFGTGIFGNKKEEAAEPKADVATVPAPEAGKHFQNILRKTY
jgi:outer membrane biosynthesis protein TonB